MDNRELAFIQKNDFLEGVFRGSIAGQIFFFKNRNTGRDEQKLGIKSWDGNTILIPEYTQAQLGVFKI